MKLYSVMCNDVESGMSGVVATFTSEQNAKDYIVNDTGDGVLTVADPIDDLDSEFDARQIALADILGCSVESVSECRHGDNQYESDDDPGKYLVLTESERESVANEALDSYIDDAILPEIPEAYRNYFDADSWKRDALMSDGYGHTIARYDSEERETKVDGVWYFVYRVN